MDDLYPSVNTSYNFETASIAEIYVYGSVIIAVALILRFACVKEPKRIYGITRRKNTDDSPVIMV